jgi:hypothetical protein
MSWWCANDPARDGLHDTSFSKEQQNNLKSLYDLLNESDPHQRIMKAEIDRERGFFKEAIEHLDTEFPEKVLT